MHLLDSELWREVKLPVEEGRRKEIHMDTEQDNIRVVSSYVKHWIFSNVDQRDIGISLGL